jgi:hypothetical protein
MKFGIDDQSIIPHFLMSVLDRKVNKRVIQLIIQIKRDLIAFCLLLLEYFNTFNNERK